jgi:hypothetical protein
MATTLRKRAVSRDFQRNLGLKFTRKVSTLNFSVFVVLWLWAAGVMCVWKGGVGGRAGAFYAMNVNASAAAKVPIANISVDAEQYATLHSHPSSVMIVLDMMMSHASGFGCPIGHLQSRQR